MHTHEMIAAHPLAGGTANDALVRAIEACHDCALTCTSCADACLGEEHVAELTQCIRLDLDCADICAVTASIATRRTGSDDRLIRAMLEICAAICERCGDECSRHADKHEHCHVCAEACRVCEAACREAAKSVRP